MAGKGEGARRVRLAGSSHRHTYPVMKRLAPMLALTLAALAAVAVVVWLSKPEPEPEPSPEAEVEEGDTGFSRAEVEARMRAIGYVL